MLVKVNFFVAFLAGFLSFLSPCMLPLLPLYLAYFSGVSMQQLNNPTFSKAQVTVTLWRNTLAFILGFTLVFVLLGATATVLGQVLVSFSGLLLSIGSVLLIFLGLYMLGLIKWSFFLQNWSLPVQTKKNTLGGAFLFGVVFSLGWTPCTGPILTSILMLAGSEKSVGEGIKLLLVYSAGLAVPFMLTVLIWGKVMTWMKWAKKYTMVLEKLAGAVMVVMGVYRLMKGGHL